MYLSGAVIFFYCHYVESMAPSIANQFVDLKLVLFHSLFLVRFVTLKRALTSFYQSLFCFELNNFLLVLLGLPLQRKISANVSFAWLILLSSTRAQSSIPGVQGNFIEH